ncbi:MAG: heparinase II/III family protein [Oscillospiraceae bacterium]|nr:heparinase II/III family protein [Oscillospiraceae bacterium]
MTVNLSRAWCGDGREAAALCKKLFPGAERRLLGRANDICKNIFIFRDHWEMEKTPEPVRFQDGIDWHFNPGGDPEWTYAFSRHSFLLTLAKAYALTGEARYVRHYSALIADWIKNVPLTEEAKATVWRPIEAGVRCENWLKSMNMIRAALPRETLQKMDEGLHVHAEYLARSHGGFQRLSNWGVLQDRGLFLAGAHLGEAGYIELSLERLNDNLRLQVLPDGIHWEQSPQYHAEVLQCLMLVIKAAGLLGIRLPGGFADTAHRMAAALALWIKPNGRLLCQSDSDDVDARDTLVTAAVCFNDASFKAVAGSEIFECNIWNLSAHEIEKYRAMQTPRLKLAHTAFEHSGNYILRDGFNFLHMRCGCLGSGHGHADLLHIDLFAHGEDILMDGGRYNYQDIPERQLLKSPAGHNTVTVDGEDFTVYKSAWDYEPIAQPVKGEYRFEGGLGYMGGGHLGYYKTGVFVFRKIIQPAPGIFVIFDEFYTGGRHTYRQYFRFNNNGQTTLDGNTARYHGPSAQASLMLLTPGLKISLGGTILSRTYNELERCARLCAEYEAEGFACLVTVIFTAPSKTIHSLSAELIPVTLTRTGETLPDEKAQAVRVTRNGREHVVVCVHNEVISEVGMLRAGKHKGYGKILVFSRDRPGGACLAW